MSVHLSAISKVPLTVLTNVDAGEGKPFFVRWGQKLVGITESICIQHIQRHTTSNNSQRHPTTANNIQQCPTTSTASITDVLGQDASGKVRVAQMPKFGKFFPQTGVDDDVEVCIKGGRNVLFSETILPFWTFVRKKIETSFFHPE